VHAEDDLLPLSALQHLMFCERQCALIHLEGVWADNELTVQGTHMHRKADSGTEESRGDLRITRGLPLRSQRLGLVGIADAVEFRRTGEGGAVAFGSDGGRWLPFPVEYKRGQPKRDHCDAVQLCAQGLCLEEMLDTTVPGGALFYGTTRRRMDVPFDDALRGETEDAAARLRALMDGGVTPRARREPKCDRCSLLNLCLPDAVAPGRSAVRWLERMLAGRDAGPAEEGGTA
jgi:CRISPR-associated exonuclease Cas4